MKSSGRHRAARSTGTKARKVFTPVVVTLAAAAIGTSTAAACPQHAPSKHHDPAPVSHPHTPAPAPHADPHHPAPHVVINLPEITVPHIEDVVIPEVHLPAIPEIHLPPAPVIHLPEIPHLGLPELPPLPPLPPLPALPPIPVIPIPIIPLPGGNLETGFDQTYCLQIGIVDGTCAGA